MRTFIYFSKNNKRTYFVALLGLVMFIGTLFTGSGVRAASATFVVEVIPFGPGSGWRLDQLTPINFLANLDQSNYVAGSSITATGGISSFPWRDNATPGVGEVTFRYQTITETVTVNGVTKTIYSKTGVTQGFGIETFTPATFTAPNSTGSYTALFQATANNVQLGPKTGSLSTSFTVSARTCTGTVPANATAYPGTNLTGLTTATNYTYAKPNTAAKCEFSCNSGYAWSGSACVAAPTVNLVATPTSVNSGGTTTLTWTSTNATSCNSTGDWANATRPLNNSTGVVPNALTSSKTYTLTCTNAANVSASDSVTVTVNTVVASCGTAAKTYLGTDTAYSGTACASGTGSLPAFPAIGGSKTWTCTGAGGGASASCTATRSDISCGGTVPANATAYTGTNLSGLTTATNYTYANPNTTAKCEYSCNSGYSWSGSACVGNPTVDIVATPATVVSGGTSSLTWTSTNTVDRCTSSGDWVASTNRPLNYSTGLTTSVLTVNKTYTLTCHNSAGVEASDSVTVTVLYPGSCNTTTINQCTHGTLLDIVDSLTEYRWMCLGVGGG